MAEFKAYSSKSHTALAVEVTVRSDLFLRVRIISVHSTLVAPHPHEKYLCGHQPRWHTFQPNELPGPFALPRVGKKINILANWLKEKGVWCEQSGQ